MDDLEIADAFRRAVVARRVDWDAMSAITTILGRDITRPENTEFANSIDDLVGEYAESDSHVPTDEIVRRIRELL